jgi:hypothetical protein
MDTVCARAEATKAVETSAQSIVLIFIRAFEACLRPEVPWKRLGLRTYQGAEVACRLFKNSPGEGTGRTGPTRHGEIRLGLKLHPTGVRLVLASS